MFLLLAQLPVITNVASFVQKHFPSFSFQADVSKRKPRSSLTPVQCESSDIAAASLPDRIEFTQFHSYLPFVNRDAQCEQLILELEKQYLLFHSSIPHNFDSVIKKFEMVYSAGAPGIGKLFYN